MTEVEVSILNWHSKPHRQANKMGGKTNNPFRGRPKRKKEDFERELKKLETKEA
jgi:hypothetical protein